MSNVYFTADFHLGHKLVAGYRGFTDVAEHDAWLAGIWDSTVGERDQVWILGDLTMGSTTAALDWVFARPGTKHIVLGNHDPVHPMHRHAAKDFERWMRVFSSVSMAATRKVAGRQVLLSHFPYWSDGDGPGREGARYEQWRLPNCGLPLLHGHTHTDVKAHGNSLHVGIDAWKEFVPLSEIEKWISELHDD